MFKKGDKINHPMHGAGIIEDIEQTEMFGFEQSFYVISAPLSKMKLMVSISKAEEIGIKLINNEGEINDAIKVLSSHITPMPENWTQRQKYNMEKLTSGNMGDVAQVLKNLYEKEVAKGLSIMEKKIIINAKQILASELMIAKGMDKESAETLIECELTRC